MNKEELQKEYFLTLRSIINTVKFDVAECVRCGVNPSQMMADLIDTAKQKLDGIIEANTPKEEPKPERGIERFARAEIEQNQKIIENLKAEMRKYHRGSENMKKAQDRMGELLKRNSELYEKIMII